jgi:hypothetical protein
MADDKVSLWGNTLKFGKSPASGEMLVGNGTGFTLTASNVIWGNPVEFTVPIKVDGQVWSTTTGFKFPDGTTQSSAATSYSPPSVANNTIQSNVSGGSAAPSANTLTQVLDGTASGTQGSLLYRNGSAWTALGPGTAGQVLTTGGTGANPSWSAGSTWTTVKKTTDQVLSTVGTYVNDDQLQFSVDANSTYAMRGAYLLPSNSRFACNGPSATLNFSVPYTNGTATTAYDSGFAVPGGTSFLYLFSINLVVGGSSGTFAMRLYNTTISTPITFLKGSYIEYMKVA